MMQRRVFIANATWGLVTAGQLCTQVHAQGMGGEPGQKGQPHYTVSAEQLQRTVAQRFPLRYAAPGLLHLDVQAPHLRLLPALNRLAAEMAVEAAGPALANSQQGTLEIDFALRWEPSDNTIRAYRLRIKQLQFPGLPPNVADLLNAYAPALAEQSLLEVVLHQFRTQDLALANAMGVRPDSITVTEQGVDIGLVAKSR